METEPDDHDKHESDDKDQDDQDQEKTDEYDAVDNSGGDNQGEIGNHENETGDGQLDPIGILVSQLSKVQQAFLKNSGVAIRIESSIDKVGGYDPNTHTIVLSVANNADILLRELIHVYQDSKGVLNDKSRSNLEFQEHVLGEISYFYKNDGSIGRLNVLDKDYAAYYQWLDKVTHGGDES